MIPPSQYSRRDHGFGAEAGGAAALETDVMRFMAILALCLVAIFALVQTLPLHAVPAPATAQRSSPGAFTQGRAVTPPAVAELPIARAKPTSVASVPTVSVPASSAAAGAPDSRLDVPPDSAPVVTTARERIVQPRADTPPEPAHADKTASLRFVTDEALLGLVAQKQVRFFALTAEPRIWSLWVRGSVAGFVAAEAPESLYEMERASVPAVILAAFERDSASPLAHVRTWGVALPQFTRAQLAERLRRADSVGELLILADGSVQERMP